MSPSRKTSASPIVVDTESGLHSVERSHGERLNFLYAQYVGCKKTQDHAAIEDAREALFRELYDYCGVVLRREQQNRNWTLPGSNVDDRLDGYDAPPRLNQLLPSHGERGRDGQFVLVPDCYQDAVTKLFENIDSFESKSKFHTWAYTVIRSVIMDAISDRIKHRGPSLTCRGGNKVKGYRREGRDDNRFQQDSNSDDEGSHEHHLMHSAILADQTRDANREYDKQKMEEWYALYEEQSIGDQRLIKLWTDDLRPAQIAKELGWPVRTVYNRIAKFKAMNPPLISPRPVNLKKREYNRRSKAKSKQSKTIPADIPVV